MNADQPGLESAADVAARAAAQIGRATPRPAGDEHRLPAWAGVVADGATEQTLAADALDQRRSAWTAAVPARFRGARLAQIDQAVRDDLAAWSGDDQRPNLVLFGAVGVGKTHAAIAACREPFGAGAGLRFAPIGELLDGLDWRRDDSSTTMAAACSVDLLIVDDLGSERANDWTGERLYLVVNRRWLDRLPTIVTTNLTPPQLADAVGERTYSRLADDALAITLTGEDRRRA